MLSLFFAEGEVQWQRKVDCTMAEQVQTKEMDGVPKAWPSPVTAVTVTELSAAYCTDKGTSVPRQSLSLKLWRH